jgi:hypothetical protein
MIQLEENIEPANILRINYGTYNDAIFLDVTLYTRNTITEWKWRNKNEKKKIKMTFISNTLLKTITMKYKIYNTIFLRFKS